MKIAIIGAGAMGCLYGAYLARNREKVWLNDVWDEHVNKINACGLSVVSPDESFVALLPATTIVTDMGKADLIIVCLKSYYTAEAALVAETVAKPDSVILTIQNGLGNAEQLAETLGAERILVGTTAMGSTILEPGHMMHGGLKKTHIGCFAGENKRLAEVVNVLNRSGLPTEVADNVQSLLWSKLAIHAGINAVTAITKVTNGEMLTIPHALQLAEMAVVEVQAVAQAAGIPLLYNNPVAEMHAYAHAMQEHRSSMLQDVNNRRKTEVDTINGMVVEHGRRLGIPTPVNETLALAIKTIEGMA